MPTQQSETPFMRLILVHTTSARLMRSDHARPVPQRNSRSKSSTRCRRLLLLALKEGEFLGSYFRLARADVQEDGA